MSRLSTSIALFVSLSTCLRLCLCLCLRFRIWLWQSSGQRCCNETWSLRRPRRSCWTQTRWIVCIKLSMVTPGTISYVVKIEANLELLWNKLRRKLNRNASLGISGVPRNSMRMDLIFVNIGSTCPMSPHGFMSCNDCKAICRRLGP